MWMAETMKISMQQMTMIQQQQHPMVSAYQPTHYFNFYSAQQVQPRPKIYRRMHINQI